MNFWQWYLSVGASIYLIFLLKDARRGFAWCRKGTARSILGGIFGSLLVWPWLLWLMEIPPNHDSKHSRTTQGHS